MCVLAAIAAAVGVMGLSSFWPGKDKSRSTAILTHGALNLIHGRVIDEFGEPVPFVMVCPIVLDGPPGEENRSWDLAGDGTRTDDQGRFELAGCDGSVLALAFHRMGYATEEHTIPAPATDMLVVMRIERCLELVVEDRRGRRVRAELAYAEISRHLAVSGRGVAEHNDAIDLPIPAWLSAYSLAELRPRVSCIEATDDESGGTFSSFAISSLQRDAHLRFVVYVGGEEYSLLSSTAVRRVRMVVEEVASLVVVISGFSEMNQAMRLRLVGQEAAEGTCLGICFATREKPMSLRAPSMIPGRYLILLESWSGERREWDFQKNLATVDVTVNQETTLGIDIRQ